MTASANSAPQCFSNSGFPEKTPTGTAHQLNPSCSDEDGDTVSYTKLSEPAHGTLSDSGGTLVYTPAAGYTGPDQFNYKATDGHGGQSAPTTRFLDVVTPAPPSCPPTSPVTVRPNGSRSFFFDCTSPFGDALTFVIDSPPARGSLSGSDAFRFFTAGSQEGDATFTWHAHSEAGGDSATQTQVIAIDNTANTAPTCSPTPVVNAKPGVQRTIFPSCTDPEFDALSYTKSTDPSHGTLTNSGGVLRYTATAGYTGPDSFTYRASDGHGGQSAVATINLNVTNNNAAPSCSGGPFSIQVESGTTTALPVPPCTDPDGDALTYEIVSQPTHGTLGTGLGGSRTYTSNAGYVGPDQLTFRASDGTDQSSVQTLNITVKPSSNHAPTCQTFSRTVAPGTPSTIQLTCTDADGDPITLAKVGNPSHGTLGAIDQGTDRVVYTPAAGYHGADSFTYRATDGTATGVEQRSRSTSPTRRSARTWPRGPRSTPRCRSRWSARTPQRRHADAVKGRQPGARHAGRDLQRRRDLHAERRRLRRRLVHIQGERRRPRARTRPRSRSP